MKFHKYAFYARVKRVTIFRTGYTGLARCTEEKKTQKKSRIIKMILQY